MKYPVIYYNGFYIQRLKFTNEATTRYFFVVDMVDEKFNTLQQAKSYIDYLTK